MEHLVRSPLRVEKANRKMEEMKENGRPASKNGAADHRRKETQA
jgi:hypothetical protein